MHGGIPGFVSLMAACCFIGLTPSVHPQAEESPDAWAPLRLLEGNWEGAVDGRFGRGTGVRSYRFVLDHQYLLTRHASVRLPQPQSPEGDYHRELGVFSFDRERNTLVYREFLVEGYVNRYRCESGRNRLVCVTEAMENGKGMRARLTLELEDRFRFVEIFELAPPGEELDVYFNVRWTRAPDLDD